MQKEITHIDYDSLLYIFLSKNELRPEMMQPNTIGDKTYATDAHAIIAIPNELLKKNYSCHTKTPNIQGVINECKEIETIHLKDVDLFRIMEKQPKMYQMSPCDSCEGEDKCRCCQQDCPYCEGEGAIEDRSLPMVYNDDQTYIQIKEKMFSAFQMGRLEKVLLETHIETFSITKESSICLLFRIGEIEIIIARMYHEAHDKRPTSILK